MAPMPGGWGFVIGAEDGVPADHAHAVADIETPHVGDVKGAGVWPDVRLIPDEIAASPECCGGEAEQHVESNERGE